jgi:hypothetical protein
VSVQRHGREQNAAPGPVGTGLACGKGDVRKEIAVTQRRMLRHNRRSLQVTSAELIAVLAVGVSQTLLMVTLAGFLLAAQRGLREELTALAKSLTEVRERIARVEGLLDGLRDAITGRRPDNAGRTDTA